MRLGLYLLNVYLPSILELLSSEDQSLLIWRNALLVLDLCLDIFDGVRRLNLQGDGLASQGLDEDLHDDSRLELCNKSSLWP